MKALMGHDLEFKYMAYPGQRHDWTSPEVEQDFVRRAEACLALHLEMCSR